MEDNKTKYMKEAIKEAVKAERMGEVPIGAVIIARGHNLKETKMNSLKHAEIIAIDKASKKLKNFRLEDCELYVTLEPCLMCAGAIIQSRIKKVCFGTPDERYGAVISTTKAFETKSNHKVEVENGICKEECSTLITKFFKKVREKNKSR